MIFATVRCPYCSMDAVPSSNNTFDYVPLFGQFCGNELVLARHSFDTVIRTKVGGIMKDCVIKVTNEHLPADSNHCRR